MNSIVVTGGAGFLGTYVVSQLHRLGYKNIHVPRSADYDLTTVDACRRMYKTFKPDTVIHLAAVCGGIGANMARPGEFFYKNLIMGANLIELARIHSIDKFVAIGSVCAYPKNTPVPFKEDDLWNGYPEETNASYGLAKRMLLAQLQAYRRQYGLKGIYLLPANLYGPGDNFDLQTSHVIPALVRKFVESRDMGLRSVTCWGTGVTTREFLYVNDAAQAIVMATRDYNGAQPVNIGTGKSISIRELAKLLRGRVDFRGSIKWDHSKPDGQPKRCLDVSRAKKGFGFTAETSLREGLDITIAWYERKKQRNLEQCPA